MPQGTRPEPDAHAKAVADIIRAEMGDEMTIADVSRTTGIPRPTLSHILNHRRQPYLSQLRAMAAAVGIPLPQLLDKAEKMQPGA